jgi:hypothetical protein
VYGTDARNPDADWGVVRTDDANDDLFTNYSVEEYANKSLLSIVGYLGVGSLLLVWPFAVLAYMLVEMGVF